MSTHTQSIEEQLENLRSDKRTLGKAAAPSYHRWQAACEAREVAIEQNAGADAWAAIEAELAAAKAEREPFMRRMAAINAQICGLEDELARKRPTGPAAVAKTKEAYERVMSVAMKVATLQLEMEKITREEAAPLLAEWADLADLGARQPVIPGAEPAAGDERDWTDFLRSALRAQGRYVPSPLGALADEDASRRAAWSRADQERHAAAERRFERARTPKLRKDVADALTWLLATAPDRLVGDLEIPPMPLDELRALADGAAADPDVVATITVNIDAAVAKASAAKQVAYDPDQVDELRRKARGWNPERGGWASPSQITPWR